MLIDVINMPRALITAKHVRDDILFYQSKSNIFTYLNTRLLSGRAFGTAITLRVSLMLTGSAISAAARAEKLRLLTFFELYSAMLSRLDMVGFTPVSQAISLYGVRFSARLIKLDEGDIYRLLMCIGHLSWIWHGGICKMPPLPAIISLPAHYYRYERR